ncbi:protein shisa-9 [Marmota marmota marmota]|uniref:protein shisa-9 n=1 Tax=Marmota marmota marmota TaxID=9994 RepID=UPI002093B71F|nr:protein shisa-9 [Marmota marmota marmota]
MFAGSYHRKLWYTSCFGGYCSQIQAERKKWEKWERADGWLESAWGERADLGTRRRETGSQARPNSAAPGALADVMRPQGHCNPDHMERDLNIVVHVQHYENTDTRAPINNLHTTQMNNAVPTSPLLQQMGHPHSYPNLGQISNPYEQQPPGKELNKYASLKAVGNSDGDWAVATLTLKSPKADKVNDDFYSKRRHLAELAAKGNLPLHPVRVEDEPRAFSPEHGPAKQNGQKSRANKMPPHPLAYNSTTNFKGWEPSEQSLRRQAYSNKGKLGMAETGSSDPLGTRTQHYPPTQPYFITNSKTEVTV